MTIYGSDTVVRANVASPSWGTATNGETWAHTQGTATTYAVTSNEATIANTPGTWDQFVLGTHTISTILEVQTHVIADVSSGSNFGVLLYAVSAGYGYWAIIDNISPHGFSLYSNTAGNGLTLLASTAFSITAGAGYYIKGRIDPSSNTLTGKIWLDSNAEPGAWTLSNVVTTANRVTSGGFGVLGAASTGLKFDHFTATDGGAVSAQTTTETTSITEAVSATTAATVSETQTVTEVVSSLVATIVPPETSIITETVVAFPVSTQSVSETTPSTESVSVAIRAAILEVQVVTETPAWLVRTVVPPETTAIVESVATAQVAVVSPTDPASQMLYDDVNIQYARLQGVLAVWARIAFIGKTYFPPAVISSEHAIPGELDILLIGETWTDLHVLRTINDVSQFIEDYMPAQSIYVQLPQLVTAAVGNSGQLSVAIFKELSIDINITGKQGTSPTIQFFLDRIGADGVNYNLWTSSTYSTTPQVVSQSIGAGLSSALSLGSAIQFRWVIGGTATPGFTYSVSLIAK